MRSLLVTLFLLTPVLSLLTAATATASTTSVGDAPADTIFHGETATEDADDDTVAVQLTVLGIVIGTVFVLGSAAYVLRWKLGRTAYTPPADTHH